MLTAGSQDCGWSQVGLGRRRSHGYSLARTSVQSAEGRAMLWRWMGRSGADRAYRGVEWNTSHRAAGSCGLPKVGSEREMITTSPHGMAVAVRPARGRWCATCRCRSEGNDGHRPRGVAQAEENVGRSTGAPPRCYSRVCGSRESRNTGCAPVAAEARAAGSGEGTRRHREWGASRRCPCA